MKKCSNIILSVCLAIGLAIAFTSCETTAGIAKPNIPMKEQCVLEFSGDGIFTYDGMELTGSGNRAILPAGKKKIQIKRSYYRIENYKETGSLITYTEYRWYELWEADFEFKPGKFYKINPISAKVTYKEGGSISSTDNVVISGGYVSHFVNKDIEIIENPKKNLGLVYISPIMGLNMMVPAYDYIPSMRILGLGPILGLQIISGYLNMDIGAEGDVNIGLSSHPSETGYGANAMGFVLGYDYGVYSKFRFGLVGLNVGAGMANGNYWYSTHDGIDGSKDYSSSYSLMPYVEFGFDIISLIIEPIMDDIPLLKNTSKYFALYGRYYFNDDEDYNKFSIGFKGHLY